MNFERFSELLDDPTVTKVYGATGGRMALYEPDRMIARFTFIHTGHPDDHGVQRRRLFFGLIPLDDLGEGIPVPTPIRNNHIIMVNAHDQLYAMTFIIIFDSANRTATVTLGERSELGEALLTDDEINGVTVNY